MLRVKKLAEGARAPVVAHPGEDLGYDLFALESARLSARETVKVRTGIAVEARDPRTGHGLGLLVRDRSSMAARGVTYAGGRIDAGYRGEILVCLVNVNQPIYSLVEDRDDVGALCNVSLVKSDVSVHLRKGDKIVQMTPLCASTHWPITVVEELTESHRGERGFGSSGR